MQRSRTTAAPMVRTSMGAALLALCMTAGMAHAQAPAAIALPLLPMPQSIVPAAGSFTVRDGTRIGAADQGATFAAQALARHVRAERELTLGIGIDGAIRFVRDAAITGAEAYRLVVTPTGVTITASTDRGLLYGAMTLAQLISADTATGRPAAVPALTITDAPRFAWRGVMIDAARHFLPIADLTALVDQLAAVKLNTLHLHLTDDQGWRFEVKKYPKLTSVGGWRTPPSTGGPAPTTRVGGFYTQAELKTLVAYAAARGVTIVPEIDLPGHAQALVAAYPDLGILGDTPAVSNDWGVMPYLFNPGPKGIAFVKDVLDELMAVFPGTYIHLGGDEAVKDQWQRSPVVQAQMKALGIKDENALQSWMIDQFGVYLQSKGRRLIGWDEILEGGLPASAAVMSWRGEKAAVEAANMGHDVVLSPGLPLYLNYAQSDLPDEPPTRFDVSSLAQVYAYDPMPKGIAPDKVAHVLGPQANFWSEYIVTPYQLQHMLFPRVGALAEKAWSAKGASDFAGFLPRVRQQGVRWTRGGMHVADSAFAVAFRIEGSRGDALRKGQVPVALSTQANYGTIRYTTDGSDPTPRSRAYAAPLAVKPGTPLTATAFDAAGNATAAPRRFDTGRAALLTRSSSQMVACPGGNLNLRVPLHPDATTNAPAFNIDLYDTCSMYPAAPLSVARGYRVDVVRVPRNFALAHDTGPLKTHYNVSAFGELLVQVGCSAAAKARAAGDKTAQPIAAGAFPLPDPATSPQRFSFTGSFPAVTGDQDVCIQFTSPLTAPYYTAERVQLTENRP